MITMNTRQQRKYSEVQEAVKRRTGWKLVSTNYVNVKTKLSFTCPNNHPREITADRFKAGCGCADCPSVKQMNAKISFEEKVKELGGKLIGEYVNNITPVDMLCEEDHPCSPTPTNIQNGQGICRVCARQDPKTSEENFINRVTQLGGKVIGKYINARKPVEVLCANGHTCYPRPGDINAGKGICFDCGTGLYVSELNFISRIAELGGTIISPYMNSYSTVIALCRKKHK